ncbi:uncharacterized protein EV420DRAFT_1485942 [Desarmillaria tabescens]|uniref:Uncharacterized protein n=1 Tax=Armillaria tabescens TaxID=1929756 RepID=A0AA39MN66_ARMTA|nr:uncharacterized protein EV420DRAFT_1485942 [Desarmillaria tabescens]KAK0440477.1 hypothetical protein EV420DRAFT_1485942 [Desarmillaria tabescens]
MVKSNSQNKEQMITATSPGKREASPGAQNGPKPKQPHSTLPLSTARMMHCIQCPQVLMQLQLGKKLGVPTAWTILTKSQDIGTTPLKKNPTEEWQSTRRQASNAGKGNQLSTTNANPYQAIVSALIPLGRVKDYIKSKEIPDRVPTVDVAALYRNNLPVIHFFIVGSVVYSDLFGLSTSKQICIQPLHFLWPRAAAAIGRIFGVGPNKVLMNNGFKGGLSFTSWLKSGDSMPVFDCQAPFKLSIYNTCPLNKVDPENGSIVLIIFTLGHYKEILQQNLTGRNPEKPLPMYLSTLDAVGVSGDDDNKNAFVGNASMEDDSEENVY